MTKTDSGFLAKHVEKLILGVGLLVLAVVAFFFIVGEPYRVEIRNVQNRSVQVGPAEIEGVIDDAVEQLDLELASPETKFKIPSIPNYAAELAATIDQSPTTVAQYAQFGGHPTDVLTGTVGDQTPWVLPNVPMPLSVIASADYGMLDFDRFQDPDFLAGVQNLVGNQVPADVRYASVGATFDMDAWRQRFERIPLEQRVPDILYRNSLFVTGAYLIRQTQDPISKRWGETKRIDPVDGQLHFLPEEDRRFDRDAGEAAVRVVKLSQPEIARPPFPPLAGGREWHEPGEPGAQLNVQQRQEVNALTRKIDALEKRIANHRKRHQLQQERRPGGVGEEFEFDDPDAFAPPVDRRVRPPSTRTTAGNRDPQAMLAEMEADLAELQRRRDAIRQGLDPDDMPEQTSPYGPEGQFPPDMLEGLTPEQIDELRATGQLGPMEGGFADPSQQHQPSGQVHVWAHDLTVQPGRTYRYKVVVSVLNPLFQNRQLPDEQAAANRHRISLAPSQIEVDAADWSEPVHVEPKYRFFVVNGSASNQNAEVEVYTIFNGAMQVERFQVQPGDPIGQVVTRTLPGGAVHNIDMRVGAVMVDIVSIPGTSGLSSARMLYLDPLTNRIAARDVNQDKNSQQRRDLEFEVNEAEAQAAQARAEDGGAFAR